MHKFLEEPLPSQHVFTGIVEATGTIEAREEGADGLRLRLSVPFEELDPGASISVSGVCLTVETHDANGGTITVFLASETVARTSLGDLAVGDTVNLERAMLADGRFDGHVVQGHVDGTAEITAIERVGGGPASDASETSPDSSAGDWRFEFSLPDALAPYLVEKGSIAVDGISLTVASLAADTFAVAIIPETYDRTTLSEKHVGDRVHLEADVLAKYVERQLQASYSGER